MSRKSYSPDFKARMALEALKELKTLNELAREYEVNPTQLRQWKRQLQEDAPHLFAQGPSPDQQADEALNAQLYQQIGQLKVELTGAKKAALFD
tara:strand:- start:13 stop:294 length:282 start_codon:yes stop_codon:yes gene_type:complete